MIQKFLHDTHRLPTEDVYTYYNRLVTDSEYINFEEPGKHITAEALRQRFLFSLGAEFDYLLTDSVEGRLDPTLLTISAEELQKRLQAILQTKKGMISIASSHPTTSSAGYAYATQKKEEPKPKSPSTTPLRERFPTPVRDRLPTRPPPKYCFTHGSLGHTSMECNTPGDGHVKEATFYNRFGGSSKNCRKQE